MQVMTTPQHPLSLSVILEGKCLLLCQYTPHDKRNSFICVQNNGTVRNLATAHWFTVSSPAHKKQTFRPVGVVWSCGG